MDVEPAEISARRPGLSDLPSFSRLVSLLSLLPFYPVFPSTPFRSLFFPSFPTRLPNPLSRLIRGTWRRVLDLLCDQVGSRFWFCPHLSLIGKRAGAALIPLLGRALNREMRLPNPPLVPVVFPSSRPSTPYGFEVGNFGDARAAFWDGLPFGRSARRSSASIWGVWERRGKKKKKSVR